jgi:hypothetical protein
LAAVWGVSVQGFHKSVLPHAPEEAIDRREKPLLVCGPGLLKAYVAKELAKQSQSDPMTGPSSPNLERWRAARADLAELEREQREGNLIPREEIHDGLVRLAARLRKFGETLQRQFGPEAHRLLEELLDDYQHELDRLSGDDRDREPGPLQPA